MTDVLGHRLKLAVVAPSTNTIVQPEFGAMSPRGITAHFARIHIPDDPIESDADFELLMQRIRSELMLAVDRAMTCRPAALVMGMSSESFWGWAGRQSGTGGQPRGARWNAGHDGLGCEPRGAGLLWGYSPYLGCHAVHAGG